ncbi:hypothetical protein M0R45_029834 [Rubus argutus]|uniref:Isopenicillin N synthase-like Fe(2+) 2OG dioxygenase domain-containing protein n=1 Tax=Rubus argutus TaxID=59490 RepID=A0AAW1WBU2_RUBAR
MAYAEYEPQASFLQLCLFNTKATYWHDSLQVWMGPELAKVDEIPEICCNEVVAWDLHATKVAESVMELLSEWLGLEAGKFKEFTFLDARVLVGHCYPYYPQHDWTVGITSHTDPGIVTVLLQNHVPGLQVRHEDEWVDIKAVPRGLIVNVWRHASGYFFCFGSLAMGQAITS